MTATEQMPARVEMDSSFVYNSFVDVELGRGYSVLVPSLVVVEKNQNGNRTEWFDFRVENESTDSKQVRILADCVGHEECHGQFIVDDGDKLATEFFKPRKNLDINKGTYLPSVISHTFGLIWAMAVANELYVEAQNYPDVGIVRKTS